MTFTELKLERISLNLCDKIMPFPLIYIKTALMELIFLKIS